jgi:SAM-dependent methyltransferase
MTDRNTPIDVGQLIAERSVQEHGQTAEEYFAKLGDWTHHLSKPFGTIDETPQLLINFAVVLQGLSLCPGMTVLEFGAGTCWAAHALTQLGCRAIAVDVSPSALRIGQELYARHPPFGDRPAPQFLLFDGHRLELPDKGVDRVVCLDSLHHVPNADEVLRELGRVLADGGIAGFAEPGPEHSKSAQSQYEMRKHGVIESDIDMRKIWNAARDAGFTALKLAVFDARPFHLELSEFEDFLAGGSIAKRYIGATRDSLQNQRTFFLFKGATQPRDSRYRQGLKALIEISPASIRVKEGEAISVRARIKNAGEVVWLPRSAGLGSVLLGCHVYLAGGEVYRESFHWEPLTPGDGEPINPGAAVEIEAHLPSLPHGSYRIEFDMVSNDVCWFAINGSQTPEIKVEVS